jgi:hypothetical protein
MAIRPPRDIDDRAAAREAADGLLGIEDPAFRRGALVRRLVALAPPEAAGFLNGLLQLAEERHAGAAALVPLLADVEELAAAIGHNAMAAILEAARDGGRPAVVRLLTSSVPRTAAAAGTDPDRPGRDALPLGWRTQLGRTGSRDTMDRLLYDPDPRVIENLLRNPRCTEREAVRIAAHRPTSPAVLSVVFRDPRWSVRYTVRRALAFNPHTTPAQAIGLLPLLLTQDLALAASDETLHREVVAAAERLLEARGAVTARPAPPLPRRAETATAEESREAIDAAAAEFLASLREQVEDVVTALEGTDAEDDDVLEVDLTEIAEEAGAAKRRQKE